MSELGIKQHAEVAAVIDGCLDPEKPKSFFLYAGAGSGKTKSLADALDTFRQLHGNRFRLRGQKISVITYTNAACDEIKRRVNFDPVIQVSTTHSFVWELIRGFNTDIKDWLALSLKAEINELEEAIKKGRPGTKTMMERERSVLSKTTRINNLHSVKTFVYSPTGDNRSKDSLNHSEVIKIGAAFLTQKNLMRKLVVSGSPFILIDESQDTNRELMEALLALQKEMVGSFGLGLFGDMMQRIYMDGKADLGSRIPPDWCKPEKTVNFRCPRRVIRLINQIRQADDGWEQVAKEDATEGVVRLFIVPTTSGNGKPQAEQRIRERMAEVTGDIAWKNIENIKTLILEHHMAARRMGFLELFEPLSEVDQFATGLREGSIGFIQFFSDQVLPVVRASRSGDAFAVGSIVRRYSPLLSEEQMLKAAKQRDQLAAAKNAVQQLRDLCDPQKMPTFQQVLNAIAESHLFEIPDALLPFVGEADNGDVETPENESDRSVAIRAFLGAPFYQIEPYTAYVGNLAPFGTHQGVKGLEFPRVMVILDDEESRGFLFSYDKLFGVKPPSKTDAANEASGKETSVSRTRRLLYVTCSRSEESLSLVAYTSNPDELRTNLINFGWFDRAEIE